MQADGGRRTLVGWRIGNDKRVHEVKARRFERSVIIAEQGQNESLIGRDDLEPGDDEGADNPAEDAQNNQGNAVKGVGMGTAEDKPAGQDDERQNQGNHDGHAVGVRRNALIRNGAENGRFLFRHGKRSFYGLK